MTTILRLMGEADQQDVLEQAVASVRGGATDARVFTVDPASFRLVPGAPFAYWVGSTLLSAFASLGAFESKGQRTAKCGAGTLDDFRFLSLAWETNPDGRRWVPFAKGGKFSRFYSGLFRLSCG